MLTPRMKLQKQWPLRNQSIPEQETKKQDEIKGQRNELYVQGPEETEIKQRIARHPEMPEEITKPR